VSLLPIPMLYASSVPATSEWYQRVLGLVSVHGGDEYDNLAYPGPDGPRSVLQLHHNKDGRALGGSGVILWFESANYADTLARIRGAAAAGMAVTIVRDDHASEASHSRQIELADPDGYAVVIASPFGTA